MKKLLLLLSLTLSIFACTQQKSRNIIALGDSNGAFDIGWVMKIDSILVNDTVKNYSKGGRTIGFDNLGRAELNELKMMESQLKDADSTLKNIDIVILSLGTNDCKACFDSLQYQVPENMKKVIDYVKSFPYSNGKTPRIIWLMPPQVAPDSMLIAKYTGISERLDNLIPKMIDVAKEEGIEYVELRPVTTPNFAEITKDGIHFKHEGYNRIGKVISEKINEKR